MKAIADLLTVTRFITQHPLSAGHKLKAFSDFFRWQVGTRILNKKVIVPWVDDSKFIAGFGETGLTGNLYAGFMEYEDMLFLLHALQASEVFVDVGANVGAYTILAAKVVQSRTIAFEPLPETVDRLRDQVQLNRIESMVDIRNIGVGDKQGALYFTNNNDTVNKVSVAGDVKNTTRVEVSTLDSELADSAEYFFKIDVEGFEYNVLEGAARILATGNVSAIIIELNGSGEEFGHSNAEIHQQLLRFNFTPVAYEPKTRTLSKLGSYNGHGGNTIYVREPDRMAERCKAAPERVVHTAWGARV